MYVYKLNVQSLFACGTYPVIVLTQITFKDLPEMCSTESFYYKGQRRSGETIN